MSVVAPFFLTSIQKQLVRDSFESIGEYSDSVVILFYGRLFELAPQVRGMFKIGIEEQARKLTDILRIVVGSLDQFEAMRPQLLQLGRRHAGYGVKPEHYPVLVAALFWAFGQALGVEFDARTRAAWGSLLDEIGKTMLEGAATAVPNGQRG